MSWDELHDVDPDELTIASVPDRDDPWATINDRPQSLEPLLELHERDMAVGLLDALATGLSQAAERAPASGAEPGAEGLSAWP